MLRSPKHPRTHLLDPAPASPGPLTCSTISLAPSWTSPDVTSLLNSERKRRRQCRMWRNFISCLYWSCFVPPLGSRLVSF